MKTWISALIALGLAAAFSSAAPARAEPAFSPAKRGEIEQIIRDYLLKNPQVLLEVMTKLEQQEKAEAERGRMDLLVKNKAALFASADDHVVNPNGKIPMVEFFDYQCGYCKRILSSVLRLTVEQKDVRIAFKEFPILGPVSVFASKAAIAAKRQGKYMEFHAAVMATKGRLSEEIVFAKAAGAGLDVARLKIDMESRQVQDIIDRNVALGGTLGIRGTPTLIIGDNLVPGAISYAKMVELIEQTKENCTIC